MWSQRLNEGGAAPKDGGEGDPGGHGMNFNSELFVLIWSVVSLKKCHDGLIVRNNSTE